VGGTSEFARIALFANVQKAIGRQTLQLNNGARTIRIPQAVLSLRNGFSASCRGPGGCREEIRGALDDPSAGTTPAELVVSPAPPLHRFLPNCSRRVRGLLLRKARSMPKRERIACTL